MGWEFWGVWWLPQAHVGLRGWGNGGTRLTLSLLLFCKRSGGRAVTPLAGRGRWQRNPRVLRSSHTPAAPADVCSAPEPGEPASTSLLALQPKSSIPHPAARIPNAANSCSPRPCRRAGFPGMKLMLSNPSTALCRQGWPQSSCSQPLNPCTDQMQGWGLGHARWGGLCEPHGDRRSLLQPTGLLGVSVHF